MPADQQNIITRGTLNIRPKTLDIKNKIKLDTKLAMINELNDKDNGKAVKLDINYSIKEEEENEDSTPVESKPAIKVDKSDKLNNQCIESNGKTTELNVSNDKAVKLDNKLNNKTNSIDESAIEKTTKPNDNSTAKQATKNKINNSTIETIVLDDSTDVENSVQILADLSIDKNPKLDNGTHIEQNGVNHNPTNDAEQQQNCLFVSNLPYSVRELNS